MVGGVFEAVMGKSGKYSPEAGQERSAREMRPITVGFYD